jgi:gliding motility-associated-like protein
MNIIVYSETSFLEIPNVFTPNNDGVNDVFGATSYRISEFKCSIYDRWGILISVISSVNEKWDGRTTAGVLAKDGTYFYVLNAMDLDGKTFENQGFIQLISN